MRTDARTLPKGHVIDADICIIGAGVAGLTIAQALIGSQINVCVLEQGGEEPDPSLQRVNRGEVVGYPYWGLDYARHAQVGGASHRWIHDLGKGQKGARFMPLEPIDFEKRAEIPYSGWPFTREELEPYYERAQALFGLGPYAYSPGDWTETEDNLFFAECPSLQSVMMQYGPRHRFTETYPDLVRKSENVTLVHHLRAQELVTSANRRAVSFVRGATPEGRSLAVRAGTFVLAAGGIGNPHLLLLSDRVHAQGLGNQRDLVGRFLMEHPHFHAGILRPVDPQQAFAADTFYRPHRQDGTVVQATVALTEKVRRREGLRNFASQLWPTSEPESQLHTSEAFESARLLRSTLRAGYLPDRALSKMADILLKSGPLFRHLFSIVRKRLRSWRGIPTPPVAYILHHVSEQAPNPESRVGLSRKVDRYGQRRVEFDLRYTEEDIAAVLRGLEIYKREMEQTGRWRVELPDYDELPPPGLRGGFHHMGTTRMHENPRRGVVDADGQVHGLGNLFVAGSSVFPTGGCANPTLTIGALSLRLADLLKERTASSPSPRRLRISDEQVRAAIGVRQ